MPSPLLQPALPRVISIHPGCCAFVRLRHLIPGLGLLLALFVAIPAWAADWVVTSSADNGPGSLREAVALANAQPGHQQIGFRPGLGPIVLESGQIEITDSLSLVGPPGGQLLSAARGSRILAVTNGQAALVLERLSLVDGWTTRTGSFNDCSASQGQGGALCALGDVRIVDSVFADNRTEGDSAHGGAIYVRGQLRIERSEFSGNSTAGAMAHGGAISTFGPLELQDSLVKDNRAGGRLSGGGGVSGRALVRLESSTLSNNVAWRDDEPAVRIGRTGTLQKSASTLDSSPDALAPASLVDQRPPARPVVADAGLLNRESFGVCLTSLDPQQAVPAILEFGSVEIGTQSDTGIMRLINPDGAALAVNIEEVFLVPFSGSPEDSFVLVDTSACTAQEIPPGGHCDVLVQSQPQVIGNAAAGLRVRTNGANRESAVRVLGVSSQLEITPDALDFGELAVGWLGEAQTVTISNPGSSPIAISALGIGGQHPGSFEILSQNCTPVIATDGSCQAEVAARPDNGGVRVGSLRVEGNGTELLIAVPLDVRGLESRYRIVPNDVLDFGTLSLGQVATRSLLIEHVDNSLVAINAIEGLDGTPFAISGGSCGQPPFLVAVGASCTVEFSFEPDSGGEFDTEALIVSNANSQVSAADRSIVLVGEATAEPALALDPSAVDFGPVPLGALSDALSVSLSNVGDAELVLGALALAGEIDDFIIDSDACSGQGLAPAASCLVSLRAGPTAIGSRLAELIIPSNAATTPDSVALSAQGIQPVLEVSPGAIDFGPVEVGSTSDAVSLALANAGDAELVLGTLTLEGSGQGDFLVGIDGCSGQTLAPLAECEIQLSASPSEDALRTATLNIPSNAASAPDEVELQVTGVIAVLNIDPAAFDFGDIEVGGSSAPTTLSLNNGGSADLVLSALALSGSEAADFNLVSDTCSGQTLAPAESCLVELTASPAAVGPRNAALEIVSNAPTSPDSVSLSVLGTQAELVLSPSSLAFGQVRVGGSESQNLTLSNPGSAAVQILEISTLAAPFELVESSCGTVPFEIVAGADCELELRFAPTATGEASAILAVTSNLAEDPVREAMLTGIGTESRLVLSTGQDCAAETGDCLDFGLVNVGELSASETLRVENQGDEPALIDQVSIIGPRGDMDGDFMLVADTCSGQLIAAQGECSLEIQAMPGSADQGRAVLSIVYDGPASPAEIELLVTGVVPELVLEPAALEFMLEFEDAGAAAEVVLSNPGTGVLMLETLAGPTSPFELSGGDCLPLPLELGPSESCQVEVSLSTVDFLGTIEGSLVITSNAADSPHVLSLTANRQAPAIAVPTLGKLALLLMTLMLATLAWIRMPLVGNAERK